MSEEEKKPEGENKGGAEAPKTERGLNIVPNDGKRFFIDNTNYLPKSVYDQFTQRITRMQAEKLKKNSPEDEKSEE